jgi:hypothetical protein
MAIPDATGGDDKTLSDVRDNVGQTFKLPDALRTEAHADSLPLVAPKPDMLPQVILQPADSGVIQTGTPAPLQVDKVNATAPLVAPQIAARPDTSIPQVASKPIEGAAIAPIAQATTQQITNPAPLQVDKVNATAPLVAPQIAARSDTSIPQVASRSIEGAATTPTPANVAPTALAQIDSSTPTKVLDKLASATTMPQVVYGGPARVETPPEAINIVPTQRIHTNPQLAITREATADIAASTQSYTRSVSPESKTAPPQPGSDSHGVNSTTPGTTPGAPVIPKDYGKTTLPPDPPTLLAALEAAAIHKSGIPSSTGFIDGTVSTSRLGLSPLQGTQAAEAIGSKQDAAGPLIAKADVRSGVVPGAPGIPGVPSVPGATDIHTTQAAQTAHAAGTSTSLDGRLIQNPNQVTALDATPGVPDPHKGLSSTIPGALGPGATDHPGEREGDKRILDVPNLNLDDKTGLSDHKDKAHETNQPGVDNTNRGEQTAITEAELANLLNRAEKGKKEKSEEGDKVDASGTAQTWVGSKRLKHKVRLGETLSGISIEYFNDDIAATLIMQINYPLLNPRAQKYGVVVTLPVDSIIEIPSAVEVVEFRRQLIAGTQTQMNISYD